VSYRRAGEEVWGSADHRLIYMSMSFGKTYFRLLNLAHGQSSPSESFRDSGFGNWFPHDQSVYSTRARSHGEVPKLFKHPSNCATRYQSIKDLLHLFLSQIFLQVFKLAEKTPLHDLRVVQ
jgi:hypothetical protein